MYTNMIDSTQDDEPCPARHVLQAMRQKNITWFTKPIHTCTQQDRHIIKLIPGYLHACACGVMPNNLAIHISIWKELYITCQVSVLDRWGYNMYILVVMLLHQVSAFIMISTNRHRWLSCALLLQNSSNRCISGHLIKCNSKAWWIAYIGLESKDKL